MLRSGLGRLPAHGEKLPGRRIFWTLAAVLGRSRKSGTLEGKFAQPKSTATATFNCYCIPVSPINVPQYISPRCYIHGSVDIFGVAIALQLRSLESVEAHTLSLNDCAERVGFRLKAEIPLDLVNNETLTMRA
jgi:hypothetical protein